MRVIYEVRAEGSKPDKECKHGFVASGDIVKCKRCGMTMTGDEYTESLQEKPKAKNGKSPGPAPQE